jgi:hypothetical protein
MSVKLWRRRTAEADPLYKVHAVSTDIAQLVRHVDGLLNEFSADLDVTVTRLRQKADEASARAEESNEPGT